MLVVRGVVEFAERGCHSVKGYSAHCSFGHHLRRFWRPRPLSMSLRWRYDSRGTIVSGAFALDFGSSVTRIASPSGEMLFEEPTLAAVELSSGRLLAFGTEAASFGAHSAGHVAMIRPVRAGKLVDVDVATAVVVEVFRRIGVGGLEQRGGAPCIHVDAAAGQRRALERAIRQAG